MKRFLQLLTVFTLLLLPSCGNERHTGNPPAAERKKSEAAAAKPGKENSNPGGNEAGESYEAWNDTIKAMGLRGDMEGARNVLKTFRIGIQDGTAARNSGKREEARKTLYVAWSNIVSFLFNKGEILDAVEEVQAMQKFAEKEKDEFGTAMVELTYGGLYTYSFKESTEHLRRALAYWEKTGNVPQTQYTLYMLSRELLGEAENTDSINLKRKIYAEVLDHCDRMERLDSTNAYMRQVSEYQRLMVHVATKEKEAAKRSYKKLEEWRRKGEVAPQLRGMMANSMAQYLVTFDDPKLATPLLAEINLPLYRLQTERLQSIATGNHRRATELQGEIDKINMQRINQLQQTQLAIANAAFNNLQLERDNHRLTLEQMERERLLIIVCIVSLAFLIIIIVLLIYQRGIRRKNLDLVQRIKEQEKEERKTLTLAAEHAGELTQEQQLFLRIEQLLQDESVLTNPELDRETIALKLGTNRTYVAQAISSCADGKSVSGYINELRVKLARRLLEDQDKSINDIVYASGFSSRSHFHNLFLAEYGITPAEYRKILKKL